MLRKGKALGQGRRAVQGMAETHTTKQTCLRVVMVTLLSRAFVWSQKEGSQALHSLGERLSVKLLN